MLKAEPSQLFDFAAKPSSVGCYIQADSRRVNLDCGPEIYRNKKSESLRSGQNLGAVGDLGLRWFKTTKSNIDELVLKKARLD